MVGRVTYLFDDPCGTPTWATWPCSNATYLRSRAQFILGAGLRQKFFQSGSFFFQDGIAVKVTIEKLFSLRNGSCTSVKLDQVVFVLVLH